MPIWVTQPAVRDEWQDAGSEGNAMAAFAAVVDGAWAAEQPIAVELLDVSEISSLADHASACATLSDQQAEWPNLEVRRHWIIYCPSRYVAIHVAKRAQQ